MGLRWRDVGSERFDWRDLLVLLKAWQKQPGNEFAAAVNGFMPWTIGEQILAVIADTLAQANWQRQGKKDAQRPKPIERPWAKAKTTRRLGADPIRIDQFDDWWDSKAKEKAANV